MKQPTVPGQRGKYLALTAALLGWMFDGLEMGLFPLVARPTLQALLPNPGETEIVRWFGVMTALFLVGAATGGVLFGWLGDRFGRVRAMTLSVLTYALFTGLCGLASSVWGIAVLRFIAALGMGGEWSLGVALVTEIWPERSRAFMAGLIGAAANVGFTLIAVVGLGLTALIEEVHSVLLACGLPLSWVEMLTANQGWRLLMIFGALPALLTFFIRLFVPESERWQREQGRGTTSHWATRDLLGIVIGGVAVCTIIYLWADDSWDLLSRLVGTVIGLLLVTGGYIYPVMRYLQRSQEAGPMAGPSWKTILGRMFLGAALSGVALLGTWGSLQTAPTWAHKLTNGLPQVREFTQIAAGVGAIIGTILAALAGDWFGRRPTYCGLCAASLVAAILFFQLNDILGYGPIFLVTVFIAGGITASFYGWLPLYLPELFPTRVRATGQGFGFNFGRIIAAIGALQLGNLMVLLGGSHPQACSILSLIYLVGVVIIWFGPETRGQPLPD